jgi:hypothetical protein
MADFHGSNCTDFGKLDSNGTVIIRNYTAREHCP